MSAGPGLTVCFFVCLFFLYSQSQNDTVARVRYETHLIVVGTFFFFTQNKTKQQQQQTNSLFS